MNEVLKTIKSRRSVRKFKPDQISQEELDMILEAGIYAPTGHNDQPWHFTVIQNQELLQDMNDIARSGMAASNIDWMQRMGSNPNYQVTYHAPTVIVVSGRKDAITWQVDCASAVQNMLLAAESLDIGSVWLGLMRFYLQKDEKLAKLGIPENYEPFYAVAFGYKADGTDLPAPKRNMDVINYIR